MIEAAKHKIVKLFFAAFFEWNGNNWQIKKI